MPDGQVLMAMNMIKHFGLWNLIKCFTPQIKRNEDEVACLLYGYNSVSTCVANVPCNNMSIYGLQPSIDDATKLTYMDIIMSFIRNDVMK